jgi:hypothetical protein
MAPSIQFCEILLRRTSTTRLTPGWGSESKKRSAFLFVKPIVKIFSMQIARLGVGLLGWLNVSDIARLRLVRLFNAVMLILNHVWVYVQHRHESLLCGTVGLDTAVCQDVLDVKVGRSEFSANKNGAVAGQGITFSAHERDSKAINTIPYASHALCKTRLFGEAVVLHLTVDVAG